MNVATTSRAQALELAKERLRRGEDLTPGLRLIVLEELEFSAATRTGAPDGVCIACCGMGTVP